MKTKAKIFLSATAAAALCLMLLFSAALAQDDSDTETTDPMQFSDEVCENVCFPRVTGGLFTCMQECSDGQNVRLPTGADYIVKKLRDRMKPPMLKSLELDPPAPKPGDTVSVTLVPAEKDPDILNSLAVKFIYSIDAPGNWTPLIPDFDPGRNVWTTQFDVPAAANSIYPTVRMGDIDGNTYIDIPCRARNPAATDPCYFPLSDDESFEGEPDFSIDPALDMLGGAFGMDDSRYYIKMNVRGDVYPGELVPRTIYYYMAGIYDPGRPTGEDPYHRTFFIFYAPYMDDVIRADCWFFGRIGSRWVMDSGAVDCKAERGTLTMSLRRGVIGDPVAGAYVLYLATGITFDADNGIIADYSPSTAVRVDRSMWNLSSRSDSE